MKYALICRNWSQAELLRRQLPKEEWTTIAVGSAICGMCFDIILIHPSCERDEEFVRWMENCVNYRFRDKKTGRVIIL